MSVRRDYITTIDIVVALLPCCLVGCWLLVVGERNKEKQKEKEKERDLVEMRKRNTPLNQFPYTPFQRALSLNSQLGVRVCVCV